MRQIQTDARGGPSDVIAHQGHFYLAFQSGEGTAAHVVIYVFNLAGERVSGAQWRSSSGAYPRLMSAHGAWWVAYHDDEERITLRKDSSVVWQSPGPSGGSNPVCVGVDADDRPSFAWQTAGANAIRVAPLLKPTDQRPEGTGTGSGLSHIAGDVVTIDEARGSVPGMTNPVSTPWVVVGEHPDGGVLARDGNNRDVHLWADRDTFTPRACADALTTVVTTWNPRDGVLLCVLEPSDFTVPEMPVEPDATFPPGKGWTLNTSFTDVDVTSCLFGPVTWSRDGVPEHKTDPTAYSHQIQSTWIEPGQSVQHTKVLGDGPRQAIWTRSDGYLGLAFDGTNEIDGGYRIVNPGTIDTARLYPDRMRVGAAHRRAVAVEILTVSSGRRRAVNWRGWADSVWDGPAIGDIPAGRYALIGWDFDILGDSVDGDPFGVSELALYHETAGWVAWRETHRRTGAVRTWYGVKNVPRVLDPITQCADRLPMAPAPITPPTPPMPTLINPSAFAERFTSVNDFYASVDGLKRPGGMVIDRDGVPTCDVEAMAAWGYRIAGGESLASVLAQIRASDEWKQKHPTPEPTPTEPPPTPEPGDKIVRPIVVDGRILRTDDGKALDYREASAFMLLARYLGQNGGSVEDVRARLVGWRDRRINTLRVFASIGHPGFWQSRGWLLTPRTPGIYRGIHDLTVLAASYGIRIRWTLLADTGDVFRDTPDVRAHVVACMDALRGLPCVIEVCNEPTMNGYGSDWAVVLADLARSLDPAAIVALGPEHGATGHLETADREPADIVYFHPERVLNEGGWAWVRRMGEYGVVKDGKRPACCGEPVNAGDEGAPGDYLRDPAIWFAYGAISRLVLSHGYALTFHFHGGLWADLPNAATQRCLDAFHEGCDAVPLEARFGAWTNGHHGTSPWRGYDQTDPPSDNRPSRIYGRIIDGVYWGVSIREPKGWNWTDLRYPVERVARVEGERFDCSVWKGRA